jgi:hypothetical protein
MSCGDAGFQCPGLATPSLGSIGQRPAGQGMARTRLTASANSCARAKFGYAEDQPVAQRGGLGPGERAAPPATPTTKPCAPWATASSASCTAASAASSAMTNRPHGDTANKSRLDTLRPWGIESGPYV